MFLAHIVPGGDFVADCHDFSDSDVGSFVGDDVEEFTTATSNSDDDQS
mgnify:CR=1 FL=1